MSTDLVRSLAALAERPPTAGQELAALETIGRALHAGHALPPEVCRWLADRSLRELAEVASALVERERVERDVAELEQADAAAIATAVLRAVIARGAGPGDVAGLPELLERTLDGRRDAAWRATPPDRAVAEYVEHGTLATWIEGTAAREPAFREELAAVIEVARAMAEPISLVARRWARGHAGEPGPIVIGVPGALAASTSAAPSAPRHLWLGRLAPWPCAARLVIDDAVLELRVDDPEHRFASVAVGGVAASRDPEGVWSARIELPREAFSIAIRDHEGAGLDEVIRLETA